MGRPLLLLALFLVSCTCANRPETDDSAASEYGTRIPLQSTVTRVQPMTGLVLWTDSKSSADYIQL